MRPSRGGLVPSPRQRETETFPPQSGRPVENPLLCLPAPAVWAPRRVCTATCLPRQGPVVGDGRGARGLVRGGEAGGRVVLT